MRNYPFLLVSVLISLISGSLTAQDFCTYEQKVLPSQANSLQGIGYSDGVAISGDYIVLGASGDDDNGWTSGAAYIYQRCGQEWIEIQKIRPDDGVQGARFGRVADIYGDYIVIGTPHDDDQGQYSGSAYVYHLVDGVWVLLQKILADDGFPVNRFGSNVKLWENYMLIGAPLDYGFKGSAYMYKLVDGEWVFDQKFSADDGVSGDNFGLTMTLNDGYAVIGAVDSDGAGESSGSAYLYKLINETWEYQTKLTASDAEAEDEFGKSFYIEGNELLVGSPNRDSYEEDGNEGGLYVFHNTQDTTWVEDQILFSPENVFTENYGVSVDRSGDRMVVGTTRGFGIDEITGAAYLYSLEGSSWEFDGKVFASDGQHADFLSSALSIQNDILLCGAKGDDSNIGNAGTAYMYHLACEPMCTKITAPPVGGVLLHDDSPITWASVDVLATGYTLAIGTQPGLDDVFATFDVGSVTSYFVPLTDGQQYYATIIPYNDYGSLDYCGSDAFTTDFNNIEAYLGEDLFGVCIDEIPPVEYSYIDTCSNVTIQLVEDTTFVTCQNNFTLVRTLTVTDDCSTFTTTQTIIGQDYFISPTILNFTDTISLDCGEVVPLMEPEAIDDCGEVTIEFLDSDVLLCGDTIIRTFTVTDLCGHTAVSTQVIIVGENISPPSCIQISSPMGEEILLNAIIEWEAVVGVDGYIVNVGTTVNGTELVNNEDVGEALMYAHSEDWPLATTIYVTVMPYNEFGPAENCISSDFITILVGIDEYTSITTEMEIFPNPSNDKNITINLLNENRSVDGSAIFITDMAGNKVGFDVLNIDRGSLSSLNLHINAQAGCYLLQVEIDNSIYRGYFVLTN